MKIFYHLDQIENTAGEILKSFPNTRIFLLKGNLGAGKTSLVQGFIRKLGLTSEVSSPTYTLIQDYSENRIRVYHLDLYRTQSLSEILDLGFWEYIDQADYIFIEWPEKIESYLDSPYLILEIETGPNENRAITVKESDFKPKLNP